MQLLPPLLPVGSALFLDFDGTLIEIAETPSAVFVPERVKDLLAQCHARLDGALAIVSGRPIADIDRLLHPLVLPVGGVHGAARRDAAGRMHSLADAHPGVRALAREFGARAARDPGILVEDKGWTLAVHFRNAPQLADDYRNAVATAIRHQGDGLRVTEGKMVLEIAPSGIGKGGAIEAYMAEAPFHGRCPAFLGDDASDEPGFEVVNRLGGITIRVGQGAVSAATHRLVAVEDSLDWLQRLADQGPAKPSRPRVGSFQ